MLGELTYAVDWTNFYIRSGPMEADWTTTFLTVRFRDDIATVELLQPVADEMEAREFVEPHLRAWELTAAVSRGWPMFSFRFVGSRLSAAPGSGSTRVALTVRTDAALAFEVGAVPIPPGKPLLGPWHEAIWTQFREFREGRRLLIPTANMCLSLLEASVRGQELPKEKPRGTAARVYQLAEASLSTIGRLAAVPDPAQGRKIATTKGVVPAPVRLTDAELGEVEQALLEVVRAVQRLAVGPG